ncbi:glucokinase [Amycolatopsis xylanica]|uniref:Glucokinase n=1 Tax=Amycolatopsis xylanica TaxID=589385 RepID=A0A1H3RME8_9PSEU|nr:ROK family protein [Amycolatopsis xylanica]SDZ26793.1 glucokinase [Amycolatopsis xylanica]
MNRVAAVDVGGTTVKAAVYEPVGDGLKRVAELRRPTARGADPGSAVADQAAAMITELGATAGPIAKAGVVVPGIVHNGLAKFSANLGFRDVPMADLLAERLDLPVAFGHDVTAGGVAEHRLGAARGFGDIAFVPVGTGIAASLLLAGRPYRADGRAGELGHVDIGHDDACGCGATGCLEAVASASAIARRFTERSGIPVDGAREVLARQGDPDADAVIAEAVDALAAALRLLATLLAPEVVVFGGGLFEAPGLLERIDDKTQLTFQRKPQLRRAELGDEAGCLGAGLLALGATR